MSFENSNPMSFEKGFANNFPKENETEKPNNEKQRETATASFGKYEILEIELGADKPIRNILLRLNIIIKEKFPDILIKSADSCSGHVNEAGQIQERLEEFYQKLENKVYYEPSIHFEATGNKETIKNIKDIFNSIFNPAVTSTNEKMGKKAMGCRIFSRLLDSYRKIYGINIEFSLYEKEKSFETLKVFYEEVEKELTKIDGLSEEKTIFNLKDFIHPPYTKKISPPED